MHPAHEACFASCARPKCLKTQAHSHERCTTKTKNEERMPAAEVGFSSVLMSRRGIGTALAMDLCCRYSDTETSVRHRFDRNPTYRVDETPFGARNEGLSIWHSACNERK
jgi:hypothetical protein